MGRWRGPAWPLAPPRPVPVAAPALPSPARPGGFETLIDNRPTGDGVRTPDEDWLHFDITELSRTWAEGDPFPVAAAHRAGAPPPKDDGSIWLRVDGVTGARW
ncbi:MAG TPA: hypothetical protein VFX88_16735 [Actinomycetota bacterium]|nr:hypothetical protein [Actinomycetota bacterium]